MQPPLPPRSPALADRDMVASCDIDCGEAVPGHRLVARGLSRGGTTDWTDWGGPSDAASVNLEYEFVPGIPPSESDNVFDYLFALDVRTEPPLPFGISGDSGTLAPFEGGVSTHGTRGEFPVLPTTTCLTFDVAATNERLLGTLTVGLGDGSVTWVSPAE